MRVTADDGRIYLPKEVRGKFGTEFELIDRGDRLVLVPLPDDPLEALREEASGTDKSVEELKQSALDALHLVQSGDDAIISSETDYDGFSERLELESYE